ncbi:MAG: alginate lyase family protein [Kiritimatiellales bacterium]
MLKNWNLHTFELNIKRMNIVAFFSTLFLAFSLSADERLALFFSSDDTARIRSNITSHNFARELAGKAVREAGKIDFDKLPHDEFKKWNTFDKPKMAGPNERFMLMAFTDAAQDAAYAWMLTGDDQFAQKSKQILLYINSYRFQCSNINSGLDYAAAVFPAMKAYDLLYERFTPEEQAEMKVFFYTAVEEVKKSNDQWILTQPAGVTFSNHEGWHNVCFAMVGFFYSDQELIDRAITGEKGFNAMLQYGFQDDSLWSEASLHYHFVQLSTMLFVADMAYHYGYQPNLYEHRIAGRSLTDLYASIIDVSFPDTLLPPVGDGYGRFRFLKNYGVYELLYTRTGNLEFAFLLNQNPVRSDDALWWGLSDIPKTDAPAMFSKLWLQHGYAVLRTQEGADYWNGEGRTLFASFSSNSGHAHADGLSIMLFWENHLWLRDTECRNSGRNTFYSDANQKLNWTTLAHNTVMIDGDSQVRNPAPLRVFEFAVTPDVKRLCIGDLSGHLYQGVQQLRTCIATADYVLDIFEIKADRPCDVAWITHVDADCDSVFSNVWKRSEWQAVAGRGFLRNKETSQETRRFWETFAQNDKHFRIDAVTTQPAKYVKTQFPLNEGNLSEQMLTRMIETVTDRIVFAVLYRCSKQRINEPVSISVQEESATHDWNVELDFNDYHIIHRVTAIK